MAVQLAVGGDDDERRPRPPGSGSSKPRARPARGRTRRRRRSRRLERDGRRQRPVVERPRRSTGRRRGRCGPGGGCRRAAIGLDLPRREDRVRRCRRRRAAAASPGRRPSRAATCRSAGGRTAPRSRAGPSGSRSAGRRPRRAAGSRGGTAGPSRSRRGRRRRSRDRRPGRRRSQPAGERRPEVPRHRPEVAELGVRAVALGADPLVPVVGRRRGRVDRHRAGERVEPRRLVEVAVDDEGGAASRGASVDGAGRGVVADGVADRPRPALARREAGAATTAAARCPGRRARSRPRSSRSSRSAPTRRRPARRRSSSTATPM